jgi:hypothetical protein
VAVDMVGPFTLLLGIHSCSAGGGGGGGGYGGGAGGYGGGGGGGYGGGEFIFAGYILLVGSAYSAYEGYRC